jgi:hypothetical protein
MAAAESMGILRSSQEFPILELNNDPTSVTFGSATYFFFFPGTKA